VRLPAARYHRLEAGVAIVQRVALRGRPRTQSAVLRSASACRPVRSLMGVNENCGCRQYEVDERARTEARKIMARTYTCPLNVIHCRALDNCNCF
jgi:hypothetical protein